MVAGEAGLERVTASSSPACAELTLAVLGTVCRLRPPQDQENSLQGGRSGRKMYEVVAAPVTGLEGVCFYAGQLEEEDPSWEAGMQRPESRKNTRSGERPRPRMRSGRQHQVLLRGQVRQDLVTAGPS